MVAAGMPGNIHVLPDFNITLCSQDGQASVAPGVEAVRREPIDPDIPGAAVASQHDVAKIFYTRIVWMVDISYLRCHYFRFCCVCEVKELVKLVRADIRYDA